jgi:uncharacterized membrane protein (DUF106 family)
MLAIIIFLCGFLGLWINIYSLFAVGLFALYYFGPFQKISWEKFMALLGFLFGIVNFILVIIARWYEGS